MRLSSELDGSVFQLCCECARLACFSELWLQPTRGGVLRNACLLACVCESAGAQRSLFSATCILLLLSCLVCLYSFSVMSGGGVPRHSAMYLLLLQELGTSRVLDLAPVFAQTSLDEDLWLRPEDIQKKEDCRQEQLFPVLATLAASMR